MAEIRSMDYPMDLGVFVRPLDFLVFGLDSSVLKIYFRHSFLMIDEAWTISHIFEETSVQFTSLSLFSCSSTTFIY